MIAFNCSGQGFFPLLGKSATAAVTYATWDNSLKGSNTTLSGGNLIATMTASNSVAQATIAGSTTGKSTGKWYWEITYTSGGGNRCIGVLSGTTANKNTWVGGDTYGFSYYSIGSGGNWFHQGTVDFGAFSVDYTVGDIIGVALDAGANTIQFYKNGVAVTPSKSITGGNYFPAVSSNVASFTANFGATAFAYSVPTGYNSGYY